MMHIDEQHMNLAIEIARQGEGLVEPNPMVGCVIVDSDGRILGQGFHSKFGEAHAEVEAVRQAIALGNEHKIRGATFYVTLEPCSHYGKTPPCCDLLLQQMPRRVVVGIEDPFPAVSGRGIEKLRTAGIEVEVGVCAERVVALNSPYLMLHRLGRPWVHAKWAMTLDGAIATRTGDSKWISNELSRKNAHQLRSRMDAVLVGVGTVLSDDPMLDSRLNSHSPPRIATRVVLDREARIPMQSKLVQTAAKIPVLIVASEQAPQDRLQSLRSSGCEVLIQNGQSNPSSMLCLLHEMGRRRWTNLLIEGGSKVLGSAFESECVDEVHCYIAPKISGGSEALRPIGGIGRDLMSKALPLVQASTQALGTDIYVHGFISRDTQADRASD